MTDDTASTIVPRAWDRASARERAALVVGALVVILALAWAFGWQPLTRDLDRLREAAPAEAAAVGRARSYADDIAALSHSAPPQRADLRASTERALGDRGLSAPSLSIDAQSDRVKVTIPASPFATLVGALDGVRKDAGAFVAEATIIPRVEPGTVRAEVTFAR
jgi:type II secretory pathway component PulM